MAKRKAINKVKPKTIKSKKPSPTALEKQKSKISKAPAMTEKNLKEKIVNKLLHNFSVQPHSASDKTFYQALAIVLRDFMREERVDFIEESMEQNAKQVYYICVEYLVGRSLKNSLYNLNLTETARKVLKDMKVNLDALYKFEPDAGLGNGGLGRLAACFMDGLANASIPAMGYSLLYDYGIFKQKIVDGWQTELPDFWLPGGKFWLLKRTELAKEVHFDGHIDEWWDDEGYHHVKHNEGNVVIAKAYDMMIPGKDGRGVSTLRLWRSTSPAIDMSLFNQGEYIRAMEQKAMAEVITHVLYPADNHREGKSLRLAQQYFLVSASIQDIIERHLNIYGSLDNLDKSVAVHINDTHPTLVIPEMMRIIMDECGFSWDDAWAVVTKCVAYTNHTVMAEALESWPEDLFEQRLPRIYQIVTEINNRFSEQMMQATGGDTEKVGRMAIISYGVIKMANLCLAASYSVNGVSQLHSDILKNQVFHDAYTVMPDKFINVTNGIAHRRWLCQANPELTNFIEDKIGDKFVTDASELSKLMPYVNDKAVLDDFMKIKRNNKERLVKYIKEKNGVIVDPDSIIDVHVKRLHEYKRQQLNAIHILHKYLELKENPNMDFVPRTYIFAAKAAPGYFLAKEIIRFISGLSNRINNDPAMKDKLKVIFLEDYNVTLAELLIPASDISQQISLAGTEASGTGNMKLMMNGALTLGTLDGANVEINQAVGNENMFLFGMTTEQVEELKRSGTYKPNDIYFSNHKIHRAINDMRQGFDGRIYSEVADAIVVTDPYMTLADFEDYCRAQDLSAEVYKDKYKWAKMAMINTASSGVFSSDRAINDYNTKIWHATKIIR